MSKERKRWLIKSADGHIRGPYHTDEVIRRIGRGEFAGEEEISLFPGGQWFSITRDPDFYDKLLETLAAGAGLAPEQVTNPAGPTSPPEREVNTPPNDQVPPDIPVEDHRQQADYDFTPAHGQFGDTAGGVPHKSSSSRSRSKSRRSKSRHSHEVIELIDVKGLVKKATLKKAIFPILLAACAIAFGALFMMPEVENEERIHLLFPRSDQPKLAPAQIRSKTKEGVRYYLRDNYSDYLKAQNEFVQVLEGDPRNAEVLALLCMVYHELWPFTYQDSRDLKVISQAAQAVSAIDPAGPNGGTCRSVDLIVRGRYIEAKGVVEAILDSYGGAAQPPIIFYYLKAKLLEHSNELQSALGYVSSAQQLWPQWLRVYVLEAEIHQKLDNPTEAAKRYRQVLKVNPQHIVSKIELGILEYKYFHHYAKGSELLREALGSKEKAARPILSRGYCGLAEISLKNNDTDHALEYAQKSYSFNSANAACKNLIVQLGGIDKLRKTKVKGQQLIFEGDQFVREGNCDAAQAHYKAAYEMNKKNGVAAMKAAKCLWELSFSTEAIEWLNRAIKADQKLVEAYTTLADYYTQRFNYLAAAQILAKAKSIAPNSHEVYRGYALVEQRRNNHNGALNFGKKALSLYDTDVETHIIMAQAALALKDYRTAYSYAAKATEIDVNNRQAQIVYAEALAGIQGLNSGIDYITNLVNRYPLITDYRMALGKMYMKDENYSEAEKIYRDIAKIEDKPKSAYIQLGRILRNQGHFENALEYLLQAAVMDPADAEPLLEAGLIYLQVKKPLDAKLQFQRVERINPRYPLIHYYIGQAELLSGNHKEALAQAETESRNNPNLADAYLLAADAHSALGQYSLCAREFQKAIQLRPQGADIYVKVAKCYRLAGNLDVALTMLNHAASMESGNPEIYKEQGAVYEMRGDLERAVEAYNQYFVLDPNAADQGQIKARIQSLQRGASF